VAVYHVDVRSVESLGGLCAVGCHVQVADAQVSNLDCWRLRLLLPNATYKPAKTYAMTEVEQPQQGLAAAPGCAGESSSTIVEGLFW